MSAANQSRKTRFVIYGLPRSGSSLLRDLLRSNPAVHCDSELLNHNYRYVRPAFLLRFFRLFPGPLLEYRSRQVDTPVYGCKLLVPQLRCGHRFFSRLAAKGWRFLRIQRRDLFHQTISFALAKSSGTWLRRVGDDESTSDLSLDEDAFVKYLKRMQQLQRREEEMLGELSHLAVIYEDDLVDRERWQATADRAGEFLGVPSEPVSSSLQRTYQLPPDRLVRNYDALVKRIEGDERLAPVLDKRLQV